MKPEARGMSETPPEVAQVRTPARRPAQAAAVREALASVVRRYREQRTHQQVVSLAGYLCEQCLDAPAVHLRDAPWGGEMGVCADCRKPASRDRRGWLSPGGARASEKANAGCKLRWKRSWLRRLFLLPPGLRTSLRCIGRPRLTHDAACTSGWPRRRHRGSCPFHRP